MDANHATYEATRQFAEQYPNLEFYPLGTTGLQVSQAGFGCYRIDPRVSNHQLALRTSLIHGINLIDTSSNYGDGDSEKLIGHTLGLLYAGGQLKREQTVIVSKVGYLQGSNYQTSQERKANGEGWPDLVEYADGLEHCIHPEFIADQLSHSTDRLQLDCIDVYLLHNPEYYLGWARKNNIPLETARNTYYERIRNAFAHLEKEVADGRIRYYGVSSNSFPESAENPEFTSLKMLWEIAEEFGSGHHFRVIQLPANLLETGAFTTQNQLADASDQELAESLGLPENLLDTGVFSSKSETKDQTVIELAHELGLGVLVNRPLNAVVGNALLRLADAPDFGTSNNDEVEARINTLLQLEQQFQQTVLPELSAESPELINRLRQYVAAGQVLQNRWYSLGTFHQWEQTVTSYLLPRLDAARSYLAQPGRLSEASTTWLQSYVEQVNLTFRSIGAIYATLAQERNLTVRAQVESAEPAWLADTLSQTAVRALRATRGVSCVLVGMRHPDYVADILAELEQPMGKSPYSDAWQQLASG